MSWKLQNYKRKPSKKI